MSPAFHSASKSILYKNSQTAAQTKSWICLKNNKSYNFSFLKKEINTLPCSDRNTIFSTIHTRTVELSLPVSSSCREESVSSKETWLLQLILPIKETQVHSYPGNTEAVTFWMLWFLDQALSCTAITQGKCWELVTHHVLVIIFSLTQHLRRNTHK